MKKTETNSMDKNFKDKIQQIRQLLAELGEQQNVHYSFNYMKTNEVGSVLDNDMLYSSEITIGILEIMNNNNKLLQTRLDRASLLMRKGVMMLNCNKSFRNGIDEIEEGNAYILEQMHVEDNGETKYFLVGKQTPFNYKRLTLVCGFSEN